MILNQEHSQSWSLYNADCVELMAEMPDDSIDYSVFSPPFAALYTYSDSIRDMGNAKNDNEFYDQFRFMVNELFRIIKPGRLVSFHCMLIPAMKERDGYIGLKDFRGDLIRIFQEAGFIFHGEVTIWKDPLVEATRTKALGLMHKQLCKDSAMCRQGLPDYVVTMRKPGENKSLISHPSGLSVYAGAETPDGKVLSHEIWRKYASPIWMDIRQTNTLNKNPARESKDERHICLAKDSFVLTKQRGYVPIQTVCVGDMVLTHMGRWRAVLAVECTGFNKKVVQVKAQGVPNLKCTPSHKIWAKDVTAYARESDYCRKVEPEWIEASKIERLYVNLKVPQEEMAHEGDENLWWLVGRWIADGHIDQRNQPIISVGFHKWDLFCSKVGRFRGNHPRGETAYQIALKDPEFELRSIISQCGNGAENKQLPPIAFSLPLQQSKWLLDGYLSGDGHYLEDRNRWTLSSVSRSLLLGLSMIVQKVHGVTASVYAGRPERTGTIAGRKVNMQQDWIMSFDMPDENRRKQSIILDDGAWKKVRSVCEAGESETWNLRVEEDESYTAEGCIVKNCPLQLDVIERCITLWTNLDEIVFSPFAGIGSEGYQAVKMGRKSIGVELKTAYYNVALSNMRMIETAPKQQEMFS